MLSEGSQTHEGHTVCDSTYVQNRQIDRDRKHISHCQGLGRGKWGASANGYKFSFWGDENILKLTMVMVA